MLFSVITVCLNPGEKLNVTLESVLRQTCTDVEVILKDGGSSDGSVEKWRQEHSAGHAAEHIAEYSAGDAAGHIAEYGAGDAAGHIAEYSAGYAAEHIAEYSAGHAAEYSAEGSAGDATEHIAERSAGNAAGHIAGRSTENIAGYSGNAGVERVKVIVEKDRGIYDAMNQAVAYAQGDFVLFLNCGDTFADDRVLERTLQALEEAKRAGADPERLVLYGDTRGGKNGVDIASPPVITGFTCYRNIPCHQSCFYSAALCREKPFDLQYRIRADYDHFLWCFYRAEAEMRHMDFPVSSYEGGGYSESRENRKRDRQEHRQITRSYMGRAELLKYRAVMACTLAPLRSAMAESRLFSGLYHRLKERIYSRRP